MESILKEMHRLAGLVGNCGRVLRRFIDRHLVAVNGKVGVVDRIPMECRDNVDFGVIAATFLDRLADVSGVWATRGVHLGVACDMVHRDLVIMALVDVIPTSVSSQKVVLSRLAEAMDDMTSRRWILEEVDLLPSRVRFLGQVAKFPGDVSFEIFEELLRGQADRIGQCAVPFVALCELMKPGSCQGLLPDEDLVLNPIGADDVEDILDGCGCIDPASIHRVSDVVAVTYQ